MSLLQTARDAIKDLPISDIVRERLLLALDRLAEAESRIEYLQSENGALKASLDRERSDHQTTFQELQKLKDQHAEEIRIHRSIEFRRGSRTGGRWVAFCPKCHMPADNRDGDLHVTCSDGGCKWYTKLNNIRLSTAVAELGS